jgi:anthranilate synthase component 1
VWARAGCWVSSPASENQECINKAAAVLGAIATANAMAIAQ